MPDIRLGIPNAPEWPERPLGELCSQISRGTAPIYVERSDVRAIGQRCVTVTGFDASRSRPHSSRALTGVLRPEAGDVLLNSTGTGTIGRSCVFDGLGFFMVDGHVTDLRPDAGSLDGSWLNAVLRSPWGQGHLERYCYSGSTNQIELNRLPLVATRIPTPPIGEQRAFAAILDTLDITIRQTESIIEKLKQVKQGLLHDLLTRGIDANGELHPPQSQAPHLYKKSPLGWIPLVWKANQLHEVGEVVTGSTPPLASPAAWGVGWPFITPSDVLTDQQICGADRSISSQGAAYVRLLPPRTTVVVCIGSTIGKVGITGVESCSNQQINALVPLSGSQPEFVQLAVQMNIGQLRAMAGLQAVPIVNKSSFASMRIPVPPVIEQVEIAVRVSAFSSRIAQEAASLAKLCELKSGLMDDLLTGRVRVTPLLAPAAP